MRAEKCFRKSQWKEWMQFIVIAFGVSSFLKRKITFPCNPLFSISMVPVRSSVVWVHVR